MDSIKISAVSYINTKPFIYGITHYKDFNNYTLSLDIPSVCAEKLLTNEVDIGLVPVAILPQLNEHHIISDYCIGANEAVNSVMLYSDVPLKNIKAIYLDYQSRTSVELARILAENFWHINPQWITAAKGFEGKIAGTTAGVVIGDRTFKMNGTFKYSYDLATEWFTYTGLPFVFACWVANKKLPATFIQSFNSALKYGIDHISEVLEQPLNTSVSPVLIKSYLTRSIQYQYDKKKQIALNTFLRLVSISKH